MKKWNFLQASQNSFTNRGEKDEMGRYLGTTKASKITQNREGIFEAAF